MSDQTPEQIARKSSDKQSFSMSAIEIREGLVLGVIVTVDKAALEALMKRYREQSVLIAQCAAGRCARCLEYTKRDT